MNTKQIKKNIKEEKELRNNLRNTIYGSLLECWNILKQKNLNDFEYNEIMRKGKFPYVDEENFIEKTCEALNIDFSEFKTLPICVVKSKWNTLFLPYIEENGNVNPMPINEEGIYPQTFWHADSIEVLEWDE